MIINLKSNTADSDIRELMSRLAKEKLTVFPVGRNPIVKVVVNGSVTEAFVGELENHPAVESISQTNGKKYKLTSRLAQSNNTIINVNGLAIGGENIVIMAGPCSVENTEQITRIAHEIKKAGANVLRGGAYKPRTAPYDFQGLEKAGLKFLRSAAQKTNLPIITEVLDPRDVEIIEKETDIFQVGTRNMQNYALLKELGTTRKPVLLKRGMWASYSEFLLAAEYIMVGGNPNVILCERGIRTHVAELRFTLDLNAIPYLKKESHLPIIVDPSHGTGRRDLVLPMSKAAIAAGADGLIIETHYDPEHSLSDADQTISITDFAQLVGEVEKIAHAVGRTRI